MGPSTIAVLQNNEDAVEEAALKQLSVWHSVKILFPQSNP